MTIGQIAKRTGLNPSAIRYYEASGILPAPARVSGRRVYGKNVLPLLAWVRFLRSTGFSIEEVRSLSGPRDIHFSAAMRLRAQAKIAELKALAAQANEMRRLLKKALRCRCLDPAACGRAILHRHPAGVSPQD